MAPRRDAALLALLAVTIAGCTGSADRNAARAADRSAATGEMAGSADAAATPEMESDADVAPGGQETGLPAGYQLRLDRAGADAAEFRVTSENEGLHVQTGPAGILYRPADAISSGDYSVSATFTELGPPVGHREAYGLFAGGGDLQGDGQAYTYFLVRGDGKYLIKRRSGAETSNVSDGWMDSEAVNAAVEGQDLTNSLEIAVRGDMAHFSANGTEVAKVPLSKIDAHGIAGVRINHNLNLRVADFTISK